VRPDLASAEQWATIHELRKAGGTRMTDNHLRLFAVASGIEGGTSNLSATDADHLILALKDRAEIAEEMS
jgi:hypothetical protein